MEKYTKQPFKEALKELMSQRYASGPFDAPRLSELVRDMGADWHYEYVRKIIHEERILRPDFIEAIARVFKVKPSYFREYRIAQVTAALDHHPELIEHIYEGALELAVRLDEKESLTRQSEQGSGSLKAPTHRGRSPKRSQLDKENPNAQEDTAPHNPHLQVAPEH